MAAPFHSTLHDEEPIGRRQTPLSLLPDHEIVKMERQRMYNLYQPFLRWHVLDAASDLVVKPEVATAAIYGCLLTRTFAAVPPRWHVCARRPVDRSAIGAVVSRAREVADDVLDTAVPALVASSPVL
jgi:hypothetical protein